MKVVPAKVMKLTCPKGHKPIGGLGRKCEQPLRAEHRGHVCLERVILAPEVRRCDRCRKGILVSEALDFSAPFCCSFCGLRYDLPSEAETADTNRRSEAMAEARRVTDAARKRRERHPLTV